MLSFSIHSSFLAIPLLHSAALYLPHIFTPLVKYPVLSSHLIFLSFFSIRFYLMPFEAIWWHCISFNLNWFHSNPFKSIRFHLTQFDPIPLDLICSPIWSYCTIWSHLIPFTLIQSHLILSIQDGSFSFVYLFWNAIAMIQWCVDPIHIWRKQNGNSGTRKSATIFGCNINIPSLDQDLKNQPCVSWYYNTKKERLVNAWKQYQFYQ